MIIMSRLECLAVTRTATIVPSAHKKGEGVSDNDRRSGGVTSSNRANRWDGTTVALPTPFVNGDLDLPAMRRHVESLVTAGVTGVSPCGTTGEAPVLSADEQIHLIEATVDTVRGRALVLAGSGSNDTAKAVRFTKAAKSAGADAALIVTPYYNRPTPEGTYRHFMAIQDAVDLPVVLYSVPSRTGAELTCDTAARVIRNGNVAAIKEAGGRVDRVTRLRRECPVPILSGDDGLTLPMLAVGARGSISVIANLVPEACIRLVQRFFAGDVDGARAIHEELDPLARCLFLETNPVPIKAALCELGRMTAEVRLPLVPLSADTAARVAAAVRTVVIARETSQPSPHSGVFAIKTLTAIG